MAKKTRGARVRMARSLAKTTKGGKGKINERKAVRKILRK